MTDSLPKHINSELDFLGVVSICSSHPEKLKILVDKTSESPYKGSTGNRGVFYKDEKEIPF